MNRDENSYSDFCSGKLIRHVGEQPRKSAARKIAKSHAPKDSIYESDEDNRDRHSYQRASIKNLTRMQLRNGQIRI